MATQGHADRFSPLSLFPVGVAAVNEQTIPNASLRSGFRNPIPNPGLGQDDLRIIRPRLDLLPELADIDPQILRVLGMRWSPDGGKDLAMRHHAPGMPRQKRQQLELFRRQPDLRTRARDTMADRVDL